MIKNITSVQSFVLSAELKSRAVIRFALAGSGFVFAVAFAVFLSLPVLGQDVDLKDSPVIVQPGSPGEPSKVLPPSTRAKLPPRSPKDVEFMQGMIMHHAQAVEMTALMESRTDNKNLLLLGSRISKSQSSEMNFMKRWLEARNEKTSMPMKMSGMNMNGMSDKKEMSAKNEMPDKKEMSDMKDMSAKKDVSDMKDMDMSEHKHHTMMMMPGMLSAKQMEGLRKSKGVEFDRLFLDGMIQHHTGALVMVRELFDTAGAGQDAELFNFTTDVDSGQRAEIRIMQGMLGEISPEEK